ncbi:MAG: DUF5704 domain-containing protein [Lachnospiraceae bacterium]|nr:DUF5704 domain-containing protein [Lachnospiraceae bacterium]
MGRIRLAEVCSDGKSAAKKRSLKRVISCLIITGLIAQLSAPLATASAAPAAYRYGDTIRGNVVSKEDKAQGNDRWSADATVTLGEGTLWWVQDHNPMQTTSQTPSLYDDLRASEKMSGKGDPFAAEGSIAAEDPGAVTQTVQGKAVFTSDESNEYVYYRTVGMRFTLEDISCGEEIVPTLDMAENSEVWEKEDVKFVDVFLEGVSDSVKLRTSALLASGASARGRRRVSDASMVNKDLSNGSGVIEGHYYIGNFLTRNSSGKIKSDCVAGQLIDLECGSDTLPTGEWRIYASHIIEIMTATREKQPNGQYILKNKRERLVRDGSGAYVPDVRTTLVDVLAAAKWAPVTHDEYLPALFNRYLELTDEKLITATTVVHYYLNSADPKGSVVETVYPETVVNNGAGFGTIKLEYGGEKGSRPENLRLELSDRAFGGSGEVFDSYGGISVFAGDRSDSYGENNAGGVGEASFRARFRLSGSVQSPFLTPVSIHDERGTSLNVVAPYVCVWVPLRSGVGVSIMYVTADDEKPVLARDGGFHDINASGGLLIPLSELAGAAAVEELSNPLLTRDGAEYELEGGATGTVIRYFFGTDCWDIIAGAATAKKNSIKDPARTVSELSLTGSATDGRRYGVMGEGFGNSVAITLNRHITDVVFFVRVVKKKPSIQTRKLYVRYVPAKGETHILKDIGPINIPVGVDYMYVHDAMGVLSYAGKDYELAKDPVNAPRALLGVWTDEEERLPRSYGTVSGSGNEEVYHRAVTGMRGEYGFTIRIPSDARDAMLFIPYDEKEDLSYGADVNIYYIGGRMRDGYRLLASEKRILPVGYYESAVAANNLTRSFTLRSDVTETVNGAHWKPLDSPGEDDFRYAVIASEKKEDSVGTMRYPDAAGETGWKSVLWSRQASEGSVCIGVVLSEGVRTYEIFVPCEIKTGSNPIKIFAIDADTGNLLLSDPITSGFMAGTTECVDVSPFEEITIGGKSYVMLGERLEQKNEYRYKTSAYAYKMISTQGVPMMSAVSSYIVNPPVYIMDSIVNPTGSDSYREMAVVVVIDGMGIPSGNVISVFIPYRTASEVNVFLLTEGDSGKDPVEAAAVRDVYRVSRSHWVNEELALTDDPFKPDHEHGGWFEFEVPAEIVDDDGVTHSISDEDPIAIHHECGCDGILQRVGLCAVSCPLCAGSGRMAAKSRTGETQRCTFCDGSGIWVTAVNYNYVHDMQNASGIGREVKKRCSRCGGTSYDPTLASHMHEKKCCPECNRNGNGPDNDCPTCGGLGGYYYKEWVNESYMDENGQLWFGSRLVTRYTTCELCGGSGDYPCGTCDGSGFVDGDLCEYCSHVHYYGSKMSVGGIRARASYGTGYNVEYRDICEYCGGRGFTLGTEGEEIACSCVSKNYLVDPDVAGVNRSYHRGSYYHDYDMYGDPIESRDFPYFMTGGYHCAKCNAYILTASTPYNTTLVLRKDGTGKNHITVFNASGMSDSVKSTLYDTQYRKVEVTDGSYGFLMNHSACGLESLEPRMTYDSAKTAVAQRTDVIRLANGPGIRMRVYVPSDLGSRTTDVYVMYTEWEAFSMPPPEPLIDPPDPFVKQADVVYTDTDTDGCDVSIVAGYNKGVTYDPSLSIPSARNLKLKAAGREYLYDIKLTNVTGMVVIPVTVRYPYAFYESSAAYRRGDAPKASGYAERIVEIKRPYSYWTVEKCAVWYLNEAGAFCDALEMNDSRYERITARPGQQTAPHFTIIRRGASDSHLMGVPPEGGMIVTVEGFYADIFKNGVPPEAPVLDEGYASRIADESVPEITALDDTLVFEGITLLGEQPTEFPGSGKSVGPSGLSPARGEVITFFSEEKKIPQTKKNGTYPVLAATVSYSKASGSVGLVDEAKYRSAGLPSPVVIQTPVYVKGSLTDAPDGFADTSGTSMNTGAEGNVASAGNTGNAGNPTTAIVGGIGTGNVGSTSGNIAYVQREEADTSQVWAVLGEERAYIGYDKKAPAQTFCTCDLYARLSNTTDPSHPHLSYPGYGIKTYNEDIYTPSGGLPYNRISFDIKVVIDRSVRGGQPSWKPDFIENYADVVLEAGEWLSVPADTVIRIIVPQNTSEGRHYVTFASVATNKEDPEDTLSTAMEIANTYYLSHAVYDRKFFYVVGRLWGLTLESVSGSGGYTSVDDTNSAQNVLTTGENNGENQNKGILNVPRTGVGDKSAAGLPLADPPGSFFPATEKEGIRAGVTAHFSIISDGVRANREIIKVFQKNQNTGQSGQSSGGPDTAATEGLYLYPEIYFVPCDNDTGELLRDEAVEADLWYDSGPYTGKPGLALFEPEIRFESLLSSRNEGISEIPLDGDNTSTGVEERNEVIIGFRLFIPAGLKATIKGALANTPRSVGFTSNDSLWLKNGVVVITFDPTVTYLIADRTVTVGYDCGPADMWKIEGYRESNGFRKGDILAFDCSSDIRDTFFVDHLN